MTCKNCLRRNECKELCEKVKGYANQDTVYYRNNTSLISNMQFNFEQQDCSHYSDDYFFNIVDSLNLTEADRLIFILYYSAGFSLKRLAAIFRQEYNELYYILKIKYKKTPLN